MRLEGGELELTFGVSLGSAMLAFLTNKNRNS